MKQARSSINIIFIIVLMFGLFETLYGWTQLLGLSASLHPRYPSTGTFYNPGPFCGYIATLSPLALYFCITPQLKFLHRLSYIYIIMSFSLMPVLMGRTGWIAAIIGCSYVLFTCKQFQRPKGKGIWIAILIITAIATLLFYLKPQSALGRLFLWRNGISAMFEHPISGVGWDNVAGALGNAQESYFSTHKNSLFKQVAGSPEYAFNDFLQIGIAYGLIGLAVFLYILYISLRSASLTKQHGIFGYFIAFIVVCLSSYPLQFPEFIITTTLIVVIATASHPKISALNIFLLSIFVSSLALFSCITIKYRKDKSLQWDKIKYTYQYLLTDKDLLSLDSLMSEHSWDNHYLFDYGKALRNNGYYEKSNTILKQGVQQSSDPMFLNLIGRNYHDIRDYAQAELYFTRSINRLPGRMYPYYLLAKLYCDPANFEPIKFKAIYNAARSIKPKVISPAIEQISHELFLLNDSIEKVERIEHPIHPAL